MQKRTYRKLICIRGLYALQNVVLLSRLLNVVIRRQKDIKIQLMEKRSTIALNALLNVCDARNERYTSNGGFIMFVCDKCYEDLHFNMED